jgi:hypothetical protein
VKDSPDLFPEVSLAAGFLPCRSKERTRHLLYLIRQESEEHEHHKDHAQVFPAQSVVVLEVVSLVLEGVEGLVLHLPPGAACAHDGVNVFTGEGEVRNPAEVLCAAGALFPVLQDIDQKIPVGRIEGHRVHKPKEMAHLGVFGIRDIVFNGIAFFDGLVETCGKVGVISLLESEDIVESVLDEVSDVGSIGTEAVLGHDGFEVRMLFSEFGEPSSAGVALTVVLVVPVMVEDGLGRQSDDFPALRVDDDRCIGLKAVGGLARLGGCLLETSGRREVFGDKVGCPVAGDQNALFHVDHILEKLASLGSAEDFREGGAQRVRLDGIEAFAYLGVAGGLFYAVDGLEIVVLGCPSPVECQEARVLEGKHGVARHEAVRHGDLGCPIARFSHFLEGLANRSVEGVCAQVLAHPDLFELALSCSLLSL